VWNQIRANVLGVPHHVAARSDATPIGAAMIAAVAAGLAPDLASLAALAPPPIAVVDPDPAATCASDEAYRRYQALVARLVVV